MTIRPRQLRAVIAARGPPSMGTPNGSTNRPSRPSPTATCERAPLRHAAAPGRSARGGPSGTASRLSPRKPMTSHGRGGPSHSTSTTSPTRTGKPVMWTIRPLISSTRPPTTGPPWARTSAPSRRARSALTTHRRAGRRRS